MEYFKLVGKILENEIIQGIVSLFKFLPFLLVKLKDRDVNWGIKNQFEGHFL